MSAPQISATSLIVRGMTCASCVASIERTLNGLAGVLSVSVSLLLETARVEHDERTRFDLTV